MSVAIPVSVKRAAQAALAMKRAGYQGGTETGLQRARQLVYCQRLPLRVIKVMRAWFARHGPDAANGGTSYPGYVKFTKASAAQRASRKAGWRGAVAWLLWGGTPGYRWVTSRRVTAALHRAGMT